MSGTLLNSGNISEYLPIGEDGRPVWTLADAFRQAVSSAPALGKKYADMLAIPRFTTGGSVANWYVPFAPSNPKGHRAVLWSAASEEEKRQALVQLKDFEQRLISFGQDLQRHPLNDDDKIFAHFLTGTSATEQLPAVHFPDENYVYIVDDRPVITFWGFMKKNGDLKSSPFAALQMPPKVAPASSKSSFEEAPATVVPVPWWRRHLLCLLLLPLALLALLLLAYLLWWWFFARAAGLPLFKSVPDLTHGSLEPLAYEQPLDKSIKDRDPIDNVGLVHNATVTDKEPHIKDGILNEDPLPADPAPLADGVVAADDHNSASSDATDVAAEDPALNDPQKDAETTGSNSDNSALLDQGNASDQEATKTDPAQDRTADDAAVDPAAVPDMNAAAAKTDPATDENGSIKLDPKDLQQGNVRALDGNWNTSSGLVDSKTGKSVSVAYKFKNGSGQAEITRSDGVKCSTATSGSAGGNTLSISGGLAACSDGGSVRLPEVKCSPGKDGKTECVGVYNQNQEKVPMDLYR